MKKENRHVWSPSVSRKGRKRAVLCSAVLAACGCAVLPAGPSAAAAEDTVIYVSPEGSDSNSGTADSPLQTLEGARNAVRKINGSASGDIIVRFADGVYRMSEAVHFSPEDSGKNGHRVIYEAAEGANPVFSGAVQVTGWTRYNDKLWSAPLNRDYKLRNFYVNDHRANMGSKGIGAKGGWGEYAVTAGQAGWAWDSGKKSDGIKYNASDLPHITSNTDDLEVVNGTTWNENIVCSRDIKYDNGSFVFLMQQPYGAIAQTPGWGAGFSTGGWHTMYNAFEFVDSPGEFYFDKTKKVLYYYPLSGEDMASADAEAPVTEQLIVIEGKSTENRVENLTFRGLTFAYTDYQLTNVAGSHGKATCQAAQSYTAFADSNWHNRKYEMADTLPGMIDVKNASSLEFTGNVIKHSGADGLNMSNDVVNSAISRNYVTDITSSGITVGHPQHIYIGDAAWNNHEKFPVGVEGLCKNDTISDNLLYDISVVHGFGGCAAITVYYADSVKVLRNQIEKTAYNGIHLGWGWCNFKDSTTCRDNMICYNRVINALNRLHDSGGIYTIGQMPGTVINENYIVGIPAGGAGAPTYGLHNDEGTAYIEENDNVLDISPNVTYTINCEDYGQKHHLTILRTYATVRKMGKNPPDSKIDDPIVVSDNVWPQAQYEVCLRSGLQDEYRSIMPASMMSDADYVLPASCAAKGGIQLPIRPAGSGKTVWVAPDSTTSFKAGASMTKANGTASKIRLPEAEGEYRIYVTDSSGKILSKSSHILRLSGSASQVAASSYSVQSGIQTESCSEGGQDVAYIENGDYIGFKDVDLNGAESVSIRLAANSGGSSVEVRLDSPTGRLLGTCNVAATGGWQTWATQTAALDAATGTHDLYFVFKGGDGYLFNVAWWKINYAEKEIRYGDLNHDDKVDARDLTLLKRAAMNDEYIAEGDLNGDGSMDAEDAAIHRDYLIGSVSSFPAAES